MPVTEWINQRPEYRQNITLIIEWYEKYIRSNFGKRAAIMAGTTVLGASVAASYNIDKL